MTVDIRLKVKVDPTFNSAVNSAMRDVSGAGTFSGTSANSLQGDNLPAAPAPQRFAMRETGSGLPAHRGGARSGAVPRSMRDGSGSKRHGAGDSVGDVPVSSNGNPFDRSRFSDELRQKPWLKDKMAHISLGENQNPRANLSVIETMMNRAVVRGTSIEQQVKRHRSSGVDEGGYYAGYAPHYSSEQRAMFDRNLGSALGDGGHGQSNVSGYATDNSSGDLARREAATGAFVRHGAPVNGESFFSPGRSEPALRNRWQSLNRRAAEFERNKAASVAARVPNTSENAP